MFYKSAYHHAPYVTTTNRCRTYIHFSRASQTPRRRVRPNRTLFLGNNFYPPKTKWPIDNLSMFYKSAYHHAQHITTTNRCRTYIHFSRTSQTPRRRVIAQIASYFWEIIFIPPKRSDPSINYLCFTNLHTTTHNISQQLIDAVPISTSHGLLKLLAAV